MAREFGHRGNPFLDFYGDWLSTVETFLVTAEQSGELLDEVVTSTRPRRWY